VKHLLTIFLIILTLGLSGQTRLRYEQLVPIQVTQLSSGIAGSYVLQYKVPQANGTGGITWQYVVGDAIADGVTTTAPSQNAVFDALASKQNTLTNPVTGTGTAGYLPKFSVGGASIQNSNVYTDGTNVGIGTTNPTSQLTQKSTTALESGTLGSELLSTANWTATGWTGTDPSVGFTHTTGNVTSLENTLIAVTNNLYQIAFTVTGRTAGSFTITYGGVTSGAYSGTNAWGPKAVSTGSFSITPTTDFNGTIVISLKQITGVSTALYAIQDNTGANNFEIRSSQASLRNTFIGAGAGRYNTTGTNNSAQGVNALYSNTTGTNNSAQGYVALSSNSTGANNSAQGYASLSSNTTGTNNSAQGVASLSSNTTGVNNSAQGVNSLYSNTTGSYNSAQGVASLSSNTTGTNNSAQGYAALSYNTTGSYNSAQGYAALSYNTTGTNNSAQGAYVLYSNSTGTNNSAQGVNSLYSNTTGSYNSAQGYAALSYNTTGTNNSAQGYAALSYNTTGTNNSAQGYNAGRYIADGTTGNTTGNYSLFLGANTKALANGQSNQIVIGYNATGNGSNTVTLGDDNIVKTLLKGNVGIGYSTGTEIDNNKLAVNGSGYFNGSLSATTATFSTVANTYSATKLLGLASDNKLTYNVSSLIQSPIILTVTGISGAATFESDILNIPQYSGVTNLSYTPSATAGVVTSSTGSSATITVVNGTNSGLMVPSDKAKLDALTVKTEIYNEVPNEQPTGSLKVFTVDHSVLSGTLRIYLNGLRQAPTIQYTATGATITFVTAPIINDIILVDYKY
jgi:hypothetical protein